MDSSVKYYGEFKMTYEECLGYLGDKFLFHKSNFVQKNQTDHVIRKIDRMLITTRAYKDRQRHQLIQLQKKLSTERIMDDKLF